MDNIKKLEREISLLSKEKALLIKALEIAGKFVRTNLPGSMPEEDTMDFIAAMCDGGRDPEGRKFTTWWLSQAKKELWGEG